MNLYDIKDPSFLKDLSIKELEELSNDIRNFIIEKVSKGGGHLSGNLGIVELTIALDRYFSNGEKLIFDVGHQCYTHKILTGRAKDFDTLRRHNGLSGFPSRSESIYDTWEVAHASTSISAQAGMIESNIPAISIIGDGALTGGEAFEALSYISSLKKKAIIILNDNNFSISPNVGFIKHMLDKMRSSKSYTKLADKNRNKKKLKGFKNWIKRLFYPSNIFDEMGFKYYGPIDGHNFKELFKYFKYADSQNRPVILHVETEKGKGYRPAEEDSLGLWHSVSPFDIETGVQKSHKDGYISYIGAVTNYMMEFYKENPNTKVVMPAMTSPSGMNSLKELMGKDFVDTGITEEFAMSFSASLAYSKNYVLLPIYSSFLMRAYDQLHQDVSMQKEHVVIAVDKAGLVPGNGKTHQGIYDISYLKTIPGLKIVAPKDYTETYKLLDYAFKHNNSPIAIHLPACDVKIDDIHINSTPIKETWEYINKIDNPSLYMITYSNLVDYIKDSMKELNIEVINARFINPIDTNMLDEISLKNKPIVVYEEAVKTDALASIIMNYYNSKNINVHIHSFGLPLDFIDIGSIEELRCDYKIDKDSIIEEVKKLI